MNSIKVGSVGPIFFIEVTSPVGSVTSVVWIRDLLPAMKKAVVQSLIVQRLSSLFADHTIVLSPLNVFGGYNYYSLE